jgi:predicted nucleic acid-binding protein
MIVIDASLAVKWYLDEPLAAAAIDLLLRESPEISAPDLFAIEVVSALVRNGNVDKSWADEARRSTGRFVELCQGGGVKLVRVSPMGLDMAAQLALDLGHPLKDCIYLALAMELGCELVTCDARFAAKAKGVWAGVRVLGD